MKGIVKFYSLAKGTGVIVGEDRKEYIVKLFGIVGTGLRRLSENEAVTFTPDGSKATQVQPIGEVK
jgi:cold shock CspA family protein